MKSLDAKGRGVGMGMGMMVMVPLAVAGVVLLAGCGGKPGRLAPPGGSLQPCPSTPNCVSTEAGDPRHAMPPLPFTGTPRDALRRARAALLAEPRTRIVTERPGYLHAEARSRLFRFVDDVEVVVDSTAGVVRFRSASRVGRGDMGVNRARMERFSARFRAAASDPPAPKSWRNEAAALPACGRAAARACPACVPRTTAGGW